MLFKNVVTKIKRYHQHLNGSTIEFGISQYQSILTEINKLKSECEKKSDDQLKNLSQKLRMDALANANLDDLLVDAFALVREAIKRTIKLNPFDVQIIGGIVMHQGKLAEMQTGEGKTLTAIFPAYLNALTGKGLHILTFNDYLARRDAEWMKPVYNYLGLSVGFVQEGMSIIDRQKAYNADITYLTAKEAGFDFLRDSICYSQKNIVHRSFNYAIVDEADSIMIDEARVPLIIAGSSDEITDNNYAIAQLAKQLVELRDFEFDEFSRNIHLTESGMKRVESKLSCINIFDEDNIGLLTSLNCALHAEYLLHRDVDYIIRNGKVELVDEFTGRIADKRRWPDGLQEAIEVKENLAIQSKGKILNSISLQHFLQLYPKLCGMTATAEIAEREFREFYNLDIVVIPQNKPCLRIDRDDIIFKSKKEKYQAIIEEIINVSRTRRPILVGTRSVYESATLAKALIVQGISCEVLNAKRAEFEAMVISKAGKLGAITISTNMAGRGTDICLGAGDADEKKQVLELGGLYVIGTDRYESRRVDNQLRGRAGRQGDPGESRFFISLEDDLFIKYRLKDLIPPGLREDKSMEAIDNPIVKNEVNRVQRIIEGQNLEIKKTLYKYSFLIEQQRKIISKRRDEILPSDIALEFYKTNLQEKYKLVLEKAGIAKLLGICKHISLFYIDQHWCNYLAEIADIRDSIHFRRLGGQEPIFEFHKLSVEIFANLLDNIEADMQKSFNQIDVENDNFDLIFDGLKSPSSTWTYLINDNTFEEMLGVQLIGNVGMQVWAGLFAPIAFLIPLMRKMSRKAKSKKLKGSNHNKGSRQK
ncbi:MAG: accessory Sec system translocase SecA2 [Ignavibacteriales bacterium]|nr:accessory Sec system translocase SecA2 [Ignavibacteriales bacterium]